MKLTDKRACVWVVEEMWPDGEWRRWHCFDSRMIAREHAEGRRGYHGQFAYHVPKVRVSKYVRAR